MMLIADRYEPTGNAAWGGMGEVNECIDKNLARRVMLKRVFKPSDYSRLLDEQKALLKLRSRHVVQLLDVVKFSWNAEEITCLVLEYIDGKNLAENSFHPGLEFQKTLWQIASGIADIHAAGVIHRDIKPENIRVDAHGVVKIFDFGLARETGLDDKTRSIIGTRGYMAPELFGSSKTISFTSAVDTYAFGCTALNLLGCSLPDVTKPVAAGAVATQLPGLGSTIASTLEACIQHDPRQRPKMSDIAALLGRDLLRDKHRARLIEPNGTTHLLHSGNRTASINSPVGSMTITYDGLTFVITSVSGSVYVNNNRVIAGTEMLSACVITIGDYQQGGARAFIPFEISNPEIMP
jgi:serine/threonine protein kinase